MPNRRVAPGHGLKTPHGIGAERKDRNSNTTSRLRDRCRARPKRVFVHNDLDVTYAPPGRHRGAPKTNLQVTAFRSKITELRRGAADGSFRPDIGEDAARRGPLLLAETASLRDTSFAQIVRSVKRGIE